MKPALLHLVTPADDDITALRAKVAQYQAGRVDLLLQLLGETLVLASEISDPGAGYAVGIREAARQLVLREGGAARGISSLNGRS